MSSSDGIVDTTHEPLSLKAACIGFAASTVAMILIMALVGNLAG